MNLTTSEQTHYRGKGVLFTVLAFAVACICAGITAPISAYASDGAQVEKTLTASSVQAAASDSADLAASLDAVRKSMIPNLGTCYSAAAGKAVVSSTNYYDVKQYEFRISLDKAGTKGVKTKTTSSNKATFKGLKQGKTYYVSARVSATVSGNVIWGYWSNAKKVKVTSKPSKAKSKIIGSWRLVKSNRNQSTIKYNNSHGAKFIFKLTGNGKGKMNDYGKARYTIKSWGATGKKAGVAALKGTLKNVLGEKATLKITGKKLKVKGANMWMVFVRA